jgi:hypothetical protein
MANFKIFRETAVPGSLQPSAIYIIAPPSKPDYVEIYVTNSTGSAARRIPTDTDIQGMIHDAVSGISNLEVVANIAERNALTPTTNQLVLVLNATGDSTVSSGAATYLYRLATASWVKISEAESLDAVVSWANIQGRPNSSPSAIDNAVTNSHTHPNKTQLDKIGENQDGLFTYNGSLPVIAWDSVAW